MDLASAWEDHAGEWIAWARAAGHDGFWHGTWPAFRAMLPPPAGPVIDLGSGEGRVCRELAGLGYRVVGVDRSATLTQAAKAASPSLAVRTGGRRSAAVRRRLRRAGGRLHVPARHR